MANGNGNGITIKSVTLAAVGVILTIVLALMASGRDQGRAQQQIATIEDKDKVQDIRLDCHEKELTALKVTDTTLTTNQAMIIKTMERQEAKLDLILRRLPPEGSGK